MPAKWQEIKPNASFLLFSKWSNQCRQSKREQMQSFASKWGQNAKCQTLFLSNAGSLDSTDTSFKPKNIHCKSRDCARFYENFVNFPGICGILRKIQFFMQFDTWFAFPFVIFHFRMKMEIIVADRMWPDSKMHRTWLKSSDFLAFMENLGACVWALFPSSSFENGKSRKRKQTSCRFA